ncbi:MAG TPA: WD40 repeat domain-containing serine/threonine-protein kinase [Kofleriaceae bacterium]|nr:WD40 repeat domain-containing serine/threonine-protein kinase [Kofleriaceae bacterium]
MGTLEQDALARTQVPTVDAKPKVRGADWRDDAPRIPGYRITAVIGEGGMGTVYAAEQEAPRRSVAIKVLQSRSGSALARFSAEAEIMARLDHPGIARIFEAGDADGHPFLVMEHVDGKTLDKFSAPLALRRKIELFSSLCEAVHHAHLKGVIHRDLKPSNVMVKTDGRVIVLDFGVAHLATPDDRTPATTRAGELIGTPLYMSPEQAQLRADKVDARTDVYTLGVILYELACNDLPFGPRDAPIGVLTGMISEDPPRPLASRDPQLKGDLDAITHKALQKEPRDRYQSVAALGDDVRRHLDGLPVTVRTPGVIERTRRFVKRRPVVAAGILAGALAAIAFAVIVTYLWRAAEDARTRTQVANNDLEARTNQLVVRQARSVLARDPTEAIGWLQLLTERGVDPGIVGIAWAIANEAIARGVAADVLRGHADEVHWVEPYAGGFVSAAYDGTVDIWEPARHLLFTTIHGRAHLARPSPDGKEFAIGGDDGALTIVAHDGRVLADLPGHAGDVQHMAWSPDGAWLITGDDHGHVIAWPHARAPGTQLIAVDNAIGSVVFSPSGKTFVASDHAGDVWQWELASFAVAHTVLADDVTDLWTDDARVIASDASGTVHWLHRDRETLALDRTVSTGLHAKRAVFAPAAAFVVLGGVGGALTEVRDDRIVPLAQFHAQVRALAISTDGAKIAAGTDDGALVVIDAASGQRSVLHGHTGRIRHVAFAEHDRVLLSADSDGIVRRWELANMPATVLDSGGVAAEKLAVADDGSFAAWVDEAGTVATWTFADHKLAVLGSIKGRATALAIANGTVITGTAEGELVWWRATPQRTKLGSIVKMIATAGGVVAVATSAGPIALFSPDGGELHPLAGNPGGTECVALDPSGTVAASGGQDRSVRVWRIRDGKQLAELPGPIGDTHLVAITDALIVAGSNGGTVLAWPRHGDDIDAAHRVLVVQHVGAVTALAATATEIATAGRDAVLARARVTGSSIAPAEIAALPNAANVVAIADDGSVRAVTRTGIGVRWASAAEPAIEIDHGLSTAVRVPHSPRWLEGFDDGTYVLTDTQARSFDELRRTVAAATTYHLISSLGR